MVLLAIGKLLSKTSTSTSWKSMFKINNITTFVNVLWKATKSAVDQVVCGVKKYFQKPLYDVTYVTYVVVVVIALLKWNEMSPIYYT
jgi:hypothetical protein